MLKKPKHSGMLHVYVSSMFTFLIFYKSFHSSLNSIKRKRRKNKKNNDHRFSHFDEMTLQLFKLLNCETVHSYNCFFLLLLYTNTFHPYAFFSLSICYPSYFAGTFLFICSNQFLAITGKHLFKFNYSSSFCLCL